MIASVRTVPTLAAGWQMFFYMAFAVVFFALPMCFISGECSSMFQGPGGPQLWFKEGISEKWGFITAWILWVQIFPGMVMVASSCGPLLGSFIGNNDLGQNHWFIMFTIFRRVLDSHYSQLKF